MERLIKKRLVKRPEMIRLYDTSRGVIPTDEENKSVTKPGYVLIFYAQRGRGEYGAVYSRKEIKTDNLVEEILRGSKINTTLQRLLENGPIIRRVTTITEEAYDKTLLDYEKPGCVGQFVRLIGLGKSLDDMLRKHFEK